MKTVEDFERLIRAVANRIYLRDVYIDTKDLIQEGRIAIWQTLQKDIKGPIDWAGVVRWAMMDALYKANTEYKAQMLTRRYKNGRKVYYLSSNEYEDEQFLGEINDKDSVFDEVANLELREVLR